MADFDQQAGVPAPASPVEPPVAPSSPEPQSVPEPTPTPVDPFQDPKVREWQSKKDRETAAALRAAQEARREAEQIRQQFEQTQRQQTQAQLQSEYQSRMAQARTDAEKRSVHAEFERRALEVRAAEQERQLLSLQEQQVYEQEVQQANAWYDYAASPEIGVPMNVLRDINQWVWSQTRDPVQASGLGAAAIMRWLAGNRGTPAPAPAPAPQPTAPVAVPVVAPGAAAGTMTHGDMWNKANRGGQQTDWAALKRALNMD